MSKNRLPKRRLLPWIREPRVASGQGVAFGRSPQRQLNHLEFPAVSTEWEHLAQDRTEWQKLVTGPSFTIGRPFVRQLRGDIRVTPEDKRRAVAQRAARIAER